MFDVVDSYGAESKCGSSKNNEEQHPHGLLLLMPSSPITSPISSASSGGVSPWAEGSILGTEYPLLTSAITSQVVVSAPSLILSPNNTERDMTSNEHTLSLSPLSSPPLSPLLSRPSSPLIFASPELINLEFVDMSDWGLWKDGDFSGK